MLDIILPMLGSYGEKILTESSPARLLESLVLLAILWRKLKPHLDKIEERMSGIEMSIRSGFQSGEERFSKIESRLGKVENALEREQ